MLAAIMGQLGGDFEVSGDGDLLQSGTRQGHALAD
jgi:hypothetical protein